MGDNNTFSYFLREMKADKKSRSFNQMSRTLMAEERIRHLLSILRNKGFVVQENFDESLSYDFLLRKYDKEVLISLEYKEDTYTLPRQHLETLYETLRLNSLSEGLIVVWVLREPFPSIYLSAFNLNRLLRKDERLYSFASETKSLEQCISDVFEKPEKLVSELKTLRKGQIFTKDKTAMSATFQKAIEKDYHQLQRKRYQLSFKQQAVAKLSSQDVEELKKIFEYALAKKFREEQLTNCIKKDLQKLGGANNDKIAYSV